LNTLKIKKKIKFKYKQADLTFLFLILIERKIDLYYKLMKNIKIILNIILFVIILFFSALPLFSKSVAVEVGSDYKLVLYDLQFASISVGNFANEEQKKKYDNLKLLFANASEEYYAQNFELAYKKFITVKENLASLFEELTIIYLNRSKEILDSTSKAAFNILIDYKKNSNLAKSFRKPFNPIENIKAYNEQEYHYFRDRDQIEKYLNNGYKKLEEAKLAYKDPDFQYQKSKKTKTKFNSDFILERYLKIISSCREAKMYGLEIHKIFNANKTGEMLLKYNISESKIEPAFDERIPETFRIDAVDNNKIVYSQLKKNLKTIKN
jgi:hypothetical protein